jgi:hypothetical protein
MNRLFGATPLAGLAFMLLAPTASAQPSAPEQKPAVDPNQRICEDVTQTGSRLATKRYCATRSEWDEKKRQDREAVEKAQMSPCLVTHNGSGGKPSC